MVISAPSVKEPGICGIVYMAKPLDACSPLTNKAVPAVSNTTSPFVLIVRGRCSFDEKVRRAQAAGFSAAIVYDDKVGDLTASMSSFLCLSFIRLTCTEYVRSQSFTFRVEHNAITII